VTYLDYINGYDHILFVLALCAVYWCATGKDFDPRHRIHHWAFDHAGLATMQIISVKTQLIEFLILNHFVTACSNLFRKKKASTEEHPNQLFFRAFLRIDSRHGFFELFARTIGQES